MTPESREIARVTSFQDCIVIGCRLPYGHEGLHDLSESVGPFPQEPAPGSPEAVLQAIYEMDVIDEHGQRVGTSEPATPEGVQQAVNRLEHVLSGRAAEDALCGVESEAVAQAAETITPEEEAALVSSYAAVTSLRAEADRAWDRVARERDRAGAFRQQRDELADALEVALSAIESLDFAAWERSGRDSAAYREATGAPSPAEAAREIREALRKAGR